MDDIGSAAELAKYRLGEAMRCLEAAKLSLEHGDYKTSANRSYYCIFHAMRAVLAIDGFDSKKHSGIISEFRKDYIKTGVFDKNYSKIIDSAFDLRGSSDYDDFYIAAKEDVLAQLNDAYDFFNSVKDFLNSDCCEK